MELLSVARTLSPTRHPFRALALLSSALLAPGCARSGDERPADAETSLYALVQTIDGTSFLPPLGPEPTTPTGTFDPTLLARLQVVLEAEDGAAHVSTLATFSAATQPGLVLLGPHELYWMNVPAATYFTNPALAYRFRALLDGREIGRSDMSSKVFEVLRYVPNLPVGVKLRIERRATPAISGLSPARVARDGGALDLTIDGTAFASDSIVRFHGHDVTTTKLSSTQLVANVPAPFVASPGSYDVVVVTPEPGGGTSAGATLSVYDPTPILTTLAPTSALAGSGPLTLTVDGAWYTTASAVTLDDAALATTFVSAERLTAVVPASMVAGTYAVRVTTPAPGGGTSTAATLTLLNPTPALAALDPSSAVVGTGALDLTIHGSGFVNGASAILAGSPAATAFVSATELRAVIPAALLQSAGSFAVTVQNPNPAAGASAAATFSVQNPRPIVWALAPASVRAGSQAFTLTLSGSSFMTGAQVSFGGAAVATTYVSASELRVSVTGAMIAAMGDVAVVVSNPAPSVGPSYGATFTVADPLPVPRTGIALYLDAAGGPSGPAFSSPGCTPSTWTDQSPYHFAGTLTNWSASECAAGQAWRGNGSTSDPYRLQLDGSDDFVRVPTASALDFTTGMTIEVWVNTSDAGGIGMLVSKMGNGNVGGYSGYYLQLWNGSFILATTGNSYQSANRPLSSNTWYQLVATYDGTTKNYYVNGNLTASARDTSGFSSSTEDLMIGRYNPGGYYLPGSIPIVAMWGRALSEAEIQSNCQANAGRFPGVSCDRPVPTLSSLTPSSATVGSAGLTLTINGTNFMTGSVARLDGTALATTFVSTTRVTALVPPALLQSAASANVTVQNPAPTAGPSAARTFPIYNPAPVLSAITPAGATLGSGDTLVTLAGSSFVAGAQATLQGNPLATTFVSSTQLVATVPAALLAAAGSFDLGVSNPAPATGASGTLVFAVNNPSPVLSSFAPGTATAGGAAFTLTVTGSAFASGAAVSFGGAAMTTTFVSASELRAAIPASAIATAGQLAISVSNPAPSLGPSATLQMTVSNPAPVITSLAPASTSAGAGAFTLTVNGTALASGAQVTFNGAALATTYASSTRVTAAVPASAVTTTGLYAVTVTNPAPGGGTSGASTFTVNNATPVLSALTPASGLAGGAAFTLTIDGSSFLAGAVASFGATSLTTTFVSSTRLTAAVPAALVAAAGTANVTVTNPAPTAGASAALVYTANNAAPSLTSMTPGTANVGAAGFTLTLNGTGFQSGATVRFNGVSLTTTYVSSTQLTAAVPASSVASAGTYNVTATNPAPTTGASSALSFVVTNPAPALSAITPASASAGGGSVTVTLTGSGFVGGSVVTFNGASLGTTYVSATQLLAVVPSTSLTNAGGFPMTVVNAAPGGGTSGAQTFTVSGVSSGNLVFYLDAGAGPAFSTPGCTPTTWADRSQYGFTATLNNWSGTECTAGGWRGNNTTASPYRLVFDGSNDYLSVPHNNTLNFTNAMTIEMWMNPASISGMVIDKFTGTTGYYIELYAGSFILSVSGNNWRGCSRGLSANTWYQLTVTYDGSNMNFYVNGAFVNSASNTAGVVGNTNDLWISQYHVAPTYARFNGSLAIVGMWNRVLTAAEVRSNCLANASRFPGITCP